MMQMFQEDMHYNNIRYTQNLLYKLYINIYSNKSNINHNNDYIFLNHLHNI